MNNGSNLGSQRTICTATAAAAAAAEEVARAEVPPAAGATLASAQLSATRAYEETSFPSRFVT